MKIRHEIDASETNISNIEIPTQIIVEYPRTDICAATMCEVQNMIIFMMLNQSHHAWVLYLCVC